MNLKQIGVIHSPYKTLEEAPRSGRLSQEEFRLEIFQDFLPGIQDIQAGDRVDIIHWGHQSDRSRLIVRPPFSDQDRGVFSTRSPHRPNPILINTVTVLNVLENGFLVSGLDAIDQTPLIDIKATMPQKDENFGE